MEEYVKQSIAASTASENVFSSPEQKCLSFMPVIFSSLMGGEIFILSMMD